MEIGKFNQMKAYLLKPKRLFTKKQDTIGGGNFEGQDLGSRTGFQDILPKQKIVTKEGLEYDRNYVNKPGRKRTIDIDDKALITEWRNSLKGDNPVPWQVFLSNKFDDKTVQSLRTRIRKDKSLTGKKSKIKFDPTKEFDVIKKKKKDTLTSDLQKLVDEHNNSDSLLYTKQDIFKKLGVSNITKRDSPVQRAVLDSLEKPEDKIKKAFDKIIADDVELYIPKKKGPGIGTANIVYQMISDIVAPPGKELSKRLTIDNRFIQGVLNTHEPYLNIKDDFDYFTKEARDFVGKKFTDGFERAKFIKGGLDLKNLQDFKGGYSKPEQNILNFAIRHAYLNHKRGAESKVTFYKINKKGQAVGKPLNFDDLPRDPKTLARVMNTDEYGFLYGNKFWTKKNLKTDGQKSGLFDEVYKVSKQQTDLVPDPNNPGNEITIRQLLKDTGDKVTVGHDDAKGGVAGEPFKNLRLESGKFNVAMFNAYNSVKDPAARAAIIDVLQDKFGTFKGEKYKEAFIKNKSQLAKDMFTSPEAVLELPTYYRGAAQQILFEQGKDFFNQPESFQKEIARVADIKLEDYAANRNKFRQFLFNEFCGLGGARKRNALGGRIGFAEGPQVCSADTVARGMQKSIQAGDSAKVLGALKQGTKLLGKVVAPIDVAIEGAFALPYLLEGDLEGAKQATTLGFFGWGKDLQEQVGDRFGENSPAFGALEKQRAIDLQVEGVFDMDQALLRGEKAGIFIKDEKGDYTQRKDLTVADQDSLKLANNLFKTGVEKTLEARNLFTNAAPKILGAQNESTALSQLGVFSDEVRSGTLNEKIGDPSIMANLFKSLNISQPAERTVEGFISTGGLGTEFPLASNVKQSELIQDRINKLKELRIADFPLDIAAQIPAYEKAQMPPQEELDMRLRQNLGIADPQLVQQYEQMGFPQLVPFLPSYANGGRIGLKEGLTPEQQGPMGPVFTTSDPKEAAKEVIRRAIEIQDADIPVSEKLKISLQGLDNVTLQGVMKILGGELYFGAGKQGSDKGMGFSFYKQFANGGRIKYAEGPEDPSKRKFLKNVGIGGGIVGGFMTGLLNLVDLFKGSKKGVVATKAAESEAEKIFLDLVDVVKNKGILKRLDDRFETKVGELYEYKGVKVLEDGENIEVRFETDKGAPAVVEYRKPGYEVDPDAQTSVQTPGEFIYEAQEIGKYGPDGDVDIDFVEEIVDPIENIKSMAKEKK